MEIRGIKEELKIECPKVSEIKKEKAEKRKFNKFTKVLLAMPFVKFLLSKGIFLKETLAAEIDGGLTSVVDREIPNKVELMGPARQEINVNIPVDTTLSFIIRIISLVTGVISFIAVIVSLINLIVRIVKKDKKNNKTIVVSIVLLVISIVLLILSSIGFFAGINF